VGFDGSKQARSALRVAADLAADLHGEVQVLSVVRPPAYAATPEQRASEAQTERQNLARAVADVRNQTQGTWEVTTDVVFADDTARAIADHAAMHGFDLVVVGGHGRERMTHGGIGRCVDELLRRHPCPVLVI
jgi:nucleotide-binding universal stress UspA family protein